MWQLSGVHECWFYPRVCLFLEAAVAYDHQHMLLIEGPWWNREGAASVFNKKPADCPCSGRSTTDGPTVALDVSHVKKTYSSFPTWAREGSDPLRRQEVVWVLCLQPLFSPEGLMSWNLSQDWNCPKASAISYRTLWTLKHAHSEKLNSDSHQILHSTVEFIEKG